MRSTFMGINIANSGLFLAQKQIDASGHNISNANTPGYTRQILIPTAVNPTYGNRLLQPTFKGIIGGGSQVMSHNQIRDLFLDRQFRAQNANYVMFETRAQGLYYIEDVFNGIGDTSLDALMSDFMNAFEELSKNPNSKEYRTLLQKSGQNMTKLFNDYYNKLVDLQNEQDLAIETQTKHLNDITRQITQLNKDIMRFEQSGNLALDLRDKRNLLLDELSGIVNIECKFYDLNGSEALQVFIGGELLIDHTDRAELSCVKDAVDLLTGVPDTYNSLYLTKIDGSGDVRLTNTGTFNPAEKFSQTLSLDLTGLNPGQAVTVSIPGYNDIVVQLDAGDNTEEAIAQKMAAAMNSATNGAYTVTESGGELTIEATVAGEKPVDFKVELKTTTFKNSLSFSGATTDGILELLGGPGGTTIAVDVKAGMTGQQIADLAAKAINDAVGSEYVAVANGDKLEVTAKDPGYKNQSFGISDPGGTGVTILADSYILTDDAGVTGTATVVNTGANSSYTPGNDILTGGELRAYFDLRDGDSKTNQGIPYFVEQLNRLVKSLVEEINTIHRSGYTGVGYDGNTNYTSKTGVDFFDPTKLTAGSICLSDDVLNSVYNIAASTLEVRQSTGGMTGNNELALAMAGLRDLKSIPVVGGFDTYYKSFLSEMASEVDTSNTMYESNAILLESIASQKEAVSGVSLDEEMTDLIRFQHAYNAAARCLTTMDEALETLIMRTGRVGL